MESYCPHGKPLNSGGYACEFCNPPMRIFITGQPLWPQPSTSDLDRLRAEVSRLTAALEEAQRERAAIVYELDDFAPEAPGVSLSLCVARLRTRLSQRVGEIESQCGWRVRLEKVRAERDAAVAQVTALEADLTEERATRDRMREILVRTADALKGEPAPLHSHDWSDLPEVAGGLRASMLEAEALSMSHEGACVRLKRERDEARARVAALETERDAARMQARAWKMDLAAEYAGNAALRGAYGAKPNETFAAFIERLHSELASARQEAWRLREALVDASDMCCQELNIDNRAGIERVMRILSLALSPAAPENKETP